MTYIYLVTNCYNDPNKVYIGKTKNIKSRELNHKKIYGYDILYTIIDNINSFSRCDWKPLESYWIEQFKVWGFNVLNKNNGGGGVEFHTEETKCKLKGRKRYDVSNKLKGSKLKQETCDKISSSKKGYIYSDDRNKKISNSLKGRKINWNKKYKVIQYSLDNSFIKEWNSISEASKAGFGYVIGVLRGRQKTAGGYKWKLKI
jgi:hypothetical protein